jgi:hypothetical protein
LAKIDALNKKQDPLSSLTPFYDNKLDVNTHGLYLHEPLTHNIWVWTLALCDLKLVS